MSFQRFLFVLVVLAVFAVSAMAKVHHYQTGAAPEPEETEQGMGILGGIKEALDDILSTAGVHNQ